MGIDFNSSFSFFLVCSGLGVGRVRVLSHASHPQRVAASDRFLNGYHLPLVSMGNDDERWTVVLCSCCAVEELFR